jgi:hypothetical protein
VVLHFLNHYYDAGDFIPGVEENLSIKSIPIALDNAFFGIGDTGPAKRGSRGSAACGVSKVALPDLGVYGCVTVPRTGRSELSMDPALATGQ